jgi:hypothetical protein
VLFVPPSLPGTSSDAWTLSREPQKGPPVLDPVRPNPSAATFVYRELSQLVQDFRFVGTAGPYTLTESPSQPVYFAAAYVIAGRTVGDQAQARVYSLGEEERPLVHIEAPILRQYSVSVVGPTKAEYRPGYRLPDDSR